MKVLSLVWFKIFPALYGGQKGIALFEEELTNYCSVLCLCSSDNATTQSATLNVCPLLPAGKAQFLNPFTWRTIAKTIHQEKTDILLLEYPYYGVVGYWAKKIKGIKLIVHEHNIEYLRFKNLGKPWWPLLKILEEVTCRNADLILFKTEQDRLTAIKSFGLKETKCVLAPYGIIEHKINSNAKDIIYNRHSIPPDCKLILFAGTLDYEPNAEAVANIYKKLAPAFEGINCRFIICGRNQKKAFAYLNELCASNVILAGAVPDIESYFSAATVFIDPVLKGGGIQTKILDALSYHLNVVCFEALTAGIPLNLCGDKLQTVPMNNWTAFTDKVKEIMYKDHTLTPSGFFSYFNIKNIVQNVITKINTL
jgi:glycosyltransferase involved in cell wall biosynthesis